MKPKFLCQKCGSPIERGDAFCGSCGEKVEWESAPGAEGVPKGKRTGNNSHTCRLCGHINPSDARACEECGASLGITSDAPPPKKSNGREGKRNAGSTPLSLIQSWKVTAGMGALLIITLIVIRYNSTQQPPPAANGMPPGHEDVVKQIQELQKEIDADPKNADAILKLGNLYYDQRIFPRSIMMYERYLELNASDPNARVDLGVSYFELALQDSTKRDEYFRSAKKEMETALTYAPRHQLAYYNLGMVNLHTGDIQKATDWFRKCYLIDSTSESGRRAQQLVKNHITAVPPS